MAMKTALKVLSPLSPAQERTAALDAFYDRCNCRNLSSGTLRFYRDKLTAFLRWLTRKELDDLALAELHPKHLRDFLIDERKRTSPQQARHCYVSLRVFFSFLVDDERLSTSPMMKVDPPKLPKKIIPALTVEQVTALLTSCGKDFYGVRDRAILLLMLDTGLRAAELLSLTVAQVDPRAAGKLVVLGKGSKQREVFFGPTTAMVLKDYLRRREGVSAPALWINHYEEPLTYSGLAQLLRRRGAAAGLPAHAAHPHAMRHTFATLFLRDGGNVFVLQRLLGHATLAMTEQYLTLTGEDLAAAHKQHSPADLLPTATTTSGRKRLR
ncbi:MAG: tyrosine-type recombinase/integrase [Armatimonadota bacterium]